MNIIARANSSYRYKGYTALATNPILRHEIKPTLLSQHSIHSCLQMANSRFLKLAAFGASTAILSGSYYGYRQYQKYNLVTSAVYLKEDKMQLSGMPNIKPTTRIQGPTNLNFDLTLFQYCSCPFCCKTRTFLEYFGVNYNIVEVNPVLRQQLKWSEKYRKVPILLAHSKSPAGTETVYQINDSSVIISSLGSFLLSKRKNIDSKNNENVHNIEDFGKILVNYQTIDVEVDGKKQKDIPNKYFLMLYDIKEQELKQRESDLAEERRWRDWADRVLVHSLSPNIYRTLPEAVQAFNNFSKMGNWEEHFSTMERMTAVYVGSAAMWLIGKRLKKRYNLKDDVRESLYDNCRHWLKAIGKDRQFMGGNQPNLADLSVFGVLRSIEGCNAFDELLQNTDIKSWYFAVKDSCQTHAGTHLVQSI